MKSLAAFALLTVLTFPAKAQPREGKTKELSISGSYQSFTSGNSSSSSSAFLFSPRLGIFVYKGLEIEPEVLLMFATGGTVYVLNANFSYNFVNEGNAVPFLLVGYGIANTVPFFNVPLTRTDFTVDVLNAGGGLKVFLTDDVALRVEYRFQSFRGERTTSYLYPQKYDVQLHIVQFGLSVML